MSINLLTKLTEKQTNVMNSYGKFVTRAGNNINNFQTSHKLKYLAIGFTLVGFISLLWYYILAGLKLIIKLFDFAARVGAKIKAIIMAGMSKLKAKRQATSAEDPNEVSQDELNVGATTEGTR